MKHVALVISASLLAACSASDKNTPAAASAAAPATAALPSGPGFTAAAHAKDIIAARQDLMTQIEQLMIPIDGLQVGDKADAKTLREHADLIAAMLMATPHLFPPNTNLYDPAVEQPATLAMPAIWQSFDGFYSLATAAAAAARDFGKTEGKDAQRKAGLALRAACDACHAGYLRPYKPSAVQESDRDFDVGAALN
jgi:cytochrome c556